VDVGSLRVALASARRPRGERPQDLDLDGRLPSLPGGFSVAIAPELRLLDVPRRTLALETYLDSRFL
jgi:hypothetical protein